MGHRKSSFFSMFNIFKSCCSDGSDYMSDGGGGGGYGRRISPSDEDRGYWVAEPGIDRRATDFIARFHATRVSDAERQTVAV